MKRVDRRSNRLVRTRQTLRSRRFKMAMWLNCSPIRPLQTHFWMTRCRLSTVLMQSHPLNRRKQPNAKPEVDEDDPNEGLIVLSGADGTERSFQSLAMVEVEGIAVLP